MLTIDSARYFKALQSKEVLDVSDVKEPCDRKPVPLMRRRKLTTDSAGCFIIAGWEEFSGPRKDVQR